MGYLKNKFLESISKGTETETEVTLSRYERGKPKKLTQAEEKQLDNLIDSQIEDAKIKREEMEKELKEKDGEAEDIIIGEKILKGDK